MKESDLILVVRNDLDKKGFTTYGEVQMDKSDKRCDMYAVDYTDNHTIAFEAKTSLNIKVIEQAYYWQIYNQSNEVYIIVPYTNRNSKKRKFYKDIIEKLGIGLMEVDMTTKHIHIPFISTWNKKAKSPTLYEQQKLTVASNSDNDYVTPFKITVQNIHDYMIDKNNENLSIVLSKVKHHYSNHKSAMGAISEMVRRGVINDYYLSKHKGRIFINKKI